MDLTKYQNINNQVIVSGHNIVPYLLNIAEYFQNVGVNVIPYPVVRISKSTEYANDPFGKTAYYNPGDHSITLFIAGRHIKDVMRSYAHELVHHKQNLEGMFNMGNMSALSDPQYAQKDEHMREMEKEAYLLGNMLFRDWEDGIK